MELKKKYKDWESVSSLLSDITNTIKEKNDMPIIAHRGDFTPAPQGFHAAVCCDVVDLGVVPSEMYGPKHKCKLVFQLESLMDDGKPFICSKFYTLSISELSNLTRDLQTWRGKAFTDDELNGFDLEKLLTVNCQVQILHVRSKQNGKMYANVEAIMPAGKGLKKLVVTDYIRVCLRPDYVPPTTLGSDVIDESPISDPDDVPF